MCEYCEGKPLKPIFTTRKNEDGYLRVSVICGKKNFRVKYSGDSYSGELKMNIKYCPMCGRELENVSNN